MNDRTTTRESAGTVSSDNDDGARLRRNRLVFGIVVAPVGVLVALVLEFVAQIGTAWRSTNDGGGAAVPQVIALVLGLAATVPAFVAGIRALRARRSVEVAWGTTVVSGLGLVAVVLLVVVPAFDVLPRAAGDERAYREQQRLDELDGIEYGDGPASAAEAREAIGPWVDDALAQLHVGPDDVRGRRWFTESTSAAGNPCQVFHERFTLGGRVEREQAVSALRSAWGSEGSATSFTERPQYLELAVYSADASITWKRADEVLLVQSDCIPFDPSGPS